MTVRHVSRAIVAGLLLCGLLAFTSAPVGAQTVVLPDEGGPITLVGCFQRLRVTPTDDPGMKFVLVRPTLGPATSVPEAACVGVPGEPMVELDDVHTNVHKHHLDRSKVGRMIEVTGRLEKKGSQLLREVHVDTYREVPVVVARAPEPAPAPEPAVVPQPVQPPLEVAPAPAGTVGVVEQLPQTASSLPLIALIGCIALIGGLALFNHRRTVRRG